MQKQERHSGRLPRDLHAYFQMKIARKDIFFIENQLFGCAISENETALLSRGVVIHIIKSERPGCVAFFVPTYQHEHTPNPSREENRGPKSITDICVHTVAAMWIG